MFSRDYYESQFNVYPDLVSLKEMRKMLGGITEKKALDLLHKKEIKAFYIKKRFVIPKICIIDYLLKDNNTSPNDKPPKKKPVQIRKPGTGCLRQINEHLWEGKFAPTNARGKRIARRVYAKSRDECEKKLEELIRVMKQEMAQEKASNNQQ